MQSHDLSLPAWGPYTKRYSGISHVPAANDGVRFDLSVFPGMYRRRVDVPNVRFESGFHPWAAAPDLSCYTFRHELLWKDQLYADISFAPLGEDARILIYCKIYHKQSLNKSISANKRIRKEKIKEKARSEWGYCLPFLFNSHFLLLSVC